MEQHLNLSKELIFVIDCGGTTTKSGAFHDGSRATGDIYYTPCNPTTCMETAVASVVTAIFDALTILDIDYILIGAAGYTDRVIPGTMEQFRTFIKEGVKEQITLTDKNLHITTDGEIAQVGCGIDKNGCMAISGTGATAYILSNGKIIKQCGGKGFGIDEGCGSKIVLDYFGNYDNPDGACEKVFDLARNGDKKALAVIQKAAKWWDDTVADIRKFGYTGTIHVVGGVARHLMEFMKPETKAAFTYSKSQLEGGYKLALEVFGKK